jgi:hypothetical protein
MLGIIEEPVVEIRFISEGREVRRRGQDDMSEAS